VRTRTLSLTAALIVPLALGCSEGGDEAIVDAGPGDTGPEDTGPLPAKEVVQAPELPAEDTAEPEPPCVAALSEEALVLDCAGATAIFTPFVIVDGAEVSGACVPSPKGLSCATDVGELRITGATSWTVSLVPTREVKVSRLGLRGAASVSGATGWLSNGFQSWSMCGVLALRDAPSDVARRTALTTQGDAETIRSGVELSWWWSAIGGGESTLVAGVARAERWKSWVGVDGNDPANLTVTLASGATESITAYPGDKVSSDPWFVAADRDDVTALTRYGAALPSRRSTPRPGEAGWNSWYELWDKVDAGAVLANAALARAAFQAGGYGAESKLRIVVDDGWQLGWGNWIPNEKFPGGLESLVTTLRADGYEAGVWLAPLLVDAEDPLVVSHPNWFVAGAEYNHAVHGPMRILDVTQPEAAAHLKQFIARIVSWGMDFLKIDFLFAGTFEGGRYEAVTGMASYQRALELIRQAAGPSVTLMAVGAPPVAGFELVDGWRLGPDIALEAFGPSWPFIGPEARNVAARWFLCSAVSCDADPPILRQLTQNEAEVGAWVAAFAGGAFFLSDDLRVLPSERHVWAFTPERLAAGIAGQASVPEAVFMADPPPRLSSAVEDAIAGMSTAMVPVVWTTPGGARVALNFGEAVIVVEGADVPPRSAVLLPPAPTN
jgi:hypothetical protein